MQVQTVWAAGKSKTNNLNTKHEKDGKNVVMHEIVKKWGLAQSQIKNLYFVRRLSPQRPDALFFTLPLDTSAQQTFIFAAAHPLWESSNWQPRALLRHHSLHSGRYEKCFNKRPPGYFIFPVQRNQA